MFNVIMRQYDWNDPTGSIEVARMFEFTDGGLAARFMDNGVPALDRLRALPCLFIPEGTQNEVCRVGTVTSARITGNEVRFEYAVDPDVPPLQNAALFALKSQLDMDRHRYNFDLGSASAASLKIEAGQVTAKAEQQPKSRRSVLWLNASGGTMDTDPRPFRLALYVGERLGQTAHNAFKIIVTPLLGRSLVGHGMIHSKVAAH